MEFVEFVEYINLLPGFLLINQDNKHISLASQSSMSVLIIHVLQIHVIKATRWRTACTVLGIISTYFNIILN